VICNERVGDDWGREVGSKQAGCSGCHVCVLSESKSMVVGGEWKGSSLCRREQQEGDIDARG